MVKNVSSVWVPSFIVDTVHKEPAISEIYKVDVLRCTTPHYKHFHSFLSCLNKKNKIIKKL